MKKSKKTVNQVEDKPDKAELSYQDRVDYQKHVERLDGIFSKMRYMDLQRECISRGMTPEELVAGDLGTLQSWLIKNWGLPQVPDRLTQFDKWRENELTKSGRNGEQFVRLGYIGEVDPETNDFNIVKPQPLKKVAIKKKRDESTGIFIGTKKALTYQCVREGLTIAETIERVKAQYPEAKDKSIKIWAKKAPKD
jgi:hypothetical protein